MAKHTSQEAYFQRLKNLAQVDKVSIKESKNRTLGTLIDYKRAADGVAYGIIKENHHYYIKKGGLKSDPDSSDFAYIGGLGNITDYQFSKLAEADKNRNMLLKTINEAVVTKVNPNGSKKKINLNEDKAAQEIGSAESMLGDLDAATAAKEMPSQEPSGEEMKAGLESEPVDAAPEGGEEMPAEEPAPEGGDDAAADLEASLGGEEDGEESPEGGDDAAADLEASLGDEEDGEEAPEGEEEMPEEDGEEVAVEDPATETTRELEKQIGKITNTIRKTELEPSQTESYLKSFIQAFKDKLPELDIEDRKEIAEKITKIVSPEDIADLGQSVEDSETAAGIEPKTIKMDTNKSDMQMAAEGVEGGRKSLFMQWYDGERQGEGSFTTGLVQLFLKADASNKMKLAKAFPDHFSIDDVYFFTGKPKGGEETAIGESQCAECGGFAQFAESRGYNSAEALMECGEEEVSSLVSGYANAHNDGMNDGDMENVALVIKVVNPEILNQLKGDYGHEEYAEKLSPIVTGMNESSDEDNIAKLNELFGGVNATNAPIDPASLETQPPIEPESDETEVEAPLTEEDEEVEVGDDTESGAEEISFAPAAQSLGGGVTKPDGAATTTVEVTKGSVNVTMSESEQKLRKYIRARLEEKVGIGKPILAEGKKSEAIKKLDSAIDKQLKLYESVAVKKIINEEKVNEIFGWSMKEKFAKLDPNNPKEVNRLFYKAFRDILINPQMGAIANAAKETNIQQRYEMLKQFVEEGGGTLRVGKNGIQFAPKSIKNNAIKSPFAGGGTQGKTQFGGTVGK